MLDLAPLDVALFTVELLEEFSYKHNSYRDIFEVFLFRLGFILT